MERVLDACHKHQCRVEDFLLIKITMFKDEENFCHFRTEQNQGRNLFTGFLIDCYFRTVMSGLVDAVSADRGDICNFTFMILAHG